MVRVTSTEFVREVGRYREAALRETVIVTEQGLDVAVMISAEEFRRLKRRDRQVFGSGELPDEILEAVVDAEMDPRHADLDELVKDWEP